MISKQVKLNATLMGLILIVCFQLTAQTIDPRVTRVSVNPFTGETDIDFIGSTHPEVTYYQVRFWDRTASGGPSGYDVPGGTIAEDGSTSYSITVRLDTVLYRPTGFTVAALSATDLIGSSASYLTDTTIFLAYEYDSCSASVQLNWNDYNGWRGNIDRYFVTIENDGGEVLVPYLPEGITDTIITGLAPDQDYFIYIIAQQSADQVRSNGIAFHTTHARYPEYINADYGTVGENNAPVTQFTIDPNSQLVNYKLLRSDTPDGAFDTIDMFMPGSNTIEYTDNTVDASIQPYYYKVQALSDCGIPILESESVAGTIFLTGGLSDGNIQLQWTSYQRWLEGISHYECQEYIDGEFRTVQNNIPASDTQISFPFELPEEGFAPNEVCYRIIAYKNLGGISPESVQSISNQVCLDFPVNLRFEINAFVPGLDDFDSFGPVMDFIPSAYSFKIYNRSGSLVFETSDPAISWNGKYQNNGTIVPQGIYRYQVVFENSGKRSVVQGSVTVARE